MRLLLLLLQILLLLLLHICFPMRLLMLHICSRFQTTSRSSDSRSSCSSDSRSSTTARAGPPRKGWIARYAAGPVQAEVIFSDQFHYEFHYDYDCDCDYDYDYHFHYAFQPWFSLSLLNVQFSPCTRFFFEREGYSID